MILRGSGSDTIALVHYDVVTTIDRYVEPEERGREAGGILIGSYRGPHIEVVACTMPMPGDVRTVTSFDRRDPGHAREAKRQWKQSGRLLTFVGEWHTHPEQMPSPSSTDLDTWEGAMKKHAPYRLLFVIRGHSGAWFGVGRAGAVLPFTADEATDWGERPPEAIAVPEPTIVGRR